MIRCAGLNAAIEGSTRNRGFTLLEMLVVLAILGLVGGLAFPAVERQMIGASFRATAAEIELAVRRAQADAVRENRTVRVQNLAQRKNTSMLIDEPAPIVFYRDGTSNGGTKAVKAGPRTFRVIVNPQTGVITSAFQ